MRYVLLDFESASRCDLKKAGAWRYAEDVSTEILCLGYGVNGGVPHVLKPNDLWPRGKLFDIVNDPDVLFVAHNVSFEKAVWRKIMVPDYGWPDIPNGRWHDTMAVCAYKSLPLKLDDVARVLRLAVQKDAEGSRLVVGMSKPNKRGELDHSPEKLARVYAYNETDIAAETGLHERLGYLPVPERNVWLLEQRMNERGIGIDLNFVRAAKKICDDAAKPDLAEFAGLTGGLKPGQTAKVIAWCGAQSIRLPNLQKATVAEVLSASEIGAEEESQEGADEEADQTTEDTENDSQFYLPYVDDLPLQVKRVLEIRQDLGSASIKKLDRMPLCTCFDGRARGLQQYHAATTGRFGGRILQPHNFPRGDSGKSGEEVDAIVADIMAGDYRSIAKKYGSPIRLISNSLRYAMIAAPGHQFLSGDYSTIELRILLAIAGQMNRVEELQAGKNQYIPVAEQIFKRAISKHDDIDEYTIGKNTVLGCGFGLGKVSFRRKYAQKRPLEFADGVVKYYRQEYAPMVPDVWYALEDAANTAVHERVPAEAYGCLYQLEDEWLTCRLPSGRKLWYFQPQPDRGPMPWDADDIRRFWWYSSKKMGRWKKIKAWGGHLTENVVQGLARDLLVNSMFKCELAGLPVILTVHDEIVAEPRQEKVDLVAFEQIMREVPAWAKSMGVPVGIEKWEGNRYRK